MTAIPTPLSQLTALPLPALGTDLTLVSRNGNLYQGTLADFLPLSSVSWASITGTPTTLAGYGITDAVPSSRTVTAGTGLSGGGALSGNISLSLANTTVVAATYGSATQAPQIAVDAQGRITSASNLTVTPAVGSLTGLGTGVATALAVNVGSAGAFVTLNGALGTPSSGTLTNTTGFPVASLAGAGTGVLTALAVNVGSAGSVVVNGGALGTPSSGTLTNTTGFPIANLAGAGAGVLTALAVNVGSAGSVLVNGGALGTPSSGTLTNTTGFPVANLAGAGTGVLAALAVNVGSAGAFVAFNGALGTPSSGTLTNTTGFPVANLAGAGTGVLAALAINVGSAGAFVTFNGAGGTPSSLTLTNATGLPVAGGGTGAATFTDGGVLIGNGTAAVQVTSAGTAGYAFNSGGSGVDPSWGNNGVRAHALFNGSGTPAFRGTPYNCTSITDTSGGTWTINFTSALPSANYSVSGIASHNTTGPQASITMLDSNTPQTVNGVSIIVSNPTPAGYDAAYVSIICVGG